MNAFIVELQNKVGELARVTEAIAAKGINITSFSGATCGTMGAVALLTNDEAGTRAALSGANCSFHETEVVPSAIEDVPGGLAKAARRLADAGVNIEAALPTGMSGTRVMVAWATDDPVKARAALGESVGASA